MIRIYIMKVPQCNHENDRIYQDLLEAVRNHIVTYNLKHCDPKKVEWRMRQLDFDYDHIYYLIYKVPCDKCTHIVSEYGKIRWNAFLGDIFDTIIAEL